MALACFPSCPNTTSRSSTRCRRSISTCRSWRTRNSKGSSGTATGGNASAGSPSTAKPDEWKAIDVVKEPTSTAGIFKVTVKGADAKGRWKPEPSHEYFGIAVDGGYKGGPIWAVKIK